MMGQARLKVHHGEDESNSSDKGEETSLEDMASDGISTPPESPRDDNASMDDSESLIDRRQIAPPAKEDFNQLLDDYREADVKNSHSNAGEGPATQRLHETRRFLYRLLDEPDSSRFASVLAWTIFSLILLSTATYCTETLPSVHQNCNSVRKLYIIDAFCVAVFTVEYFLRWFASPNPLLFPLSMKNIIDIIAIIPFYVDPLPPNCNADGSYFGMEDGVTSIGGSSVDLRFLRLLRVFRTFKLSGYGPQLELVTNAVKESQEMLMMFIINLMIVIIVFSSMIYLCERNVDEEGMTGTAFDSIPASCWWAIVTVLTVGYGDMSPTTVQGKLVASLLMIIALVVIALPVSIIGTNFTLEWEKSKNEQKAILRASKLPSKLKDIYPQLETWMEDVAKHCYDLRKETRELKVVSRDIKTVQPQDQLEMMEKLVKSANTLTGLASDDVEESVNACSAIAKRLESIHQKLMELNEDAKEQLQDSLQVAQETFSNAVLRMAAQEVREESPAEEQGGVIPKIMRRSTVVPASILRNDLQNFDGVAIFHVLGCKDVTGVAKLSDVPDPYATFCSGKETGRTTVVNNSSSPLFDENVMLLVQDPEEPISIDVWDKENWVKDQYLGSHKFLLPLETGNGQFVPAKPEWSEHTKLGLMLNNKPAGSIMFRFQYHPFSQFNEEALRDRALWPKMCALMTNIDVDGGFGSLLKKQREPKAEEPAAPHRLMDLVKDIDKIKDFVQHTDEPESSSKEVVLPGNPLSRLSSATWADVVPRNVMASGQDESPTPSGRGRRLPGGGNQRIRETKNVSPPESGKSLLSRDPSK